jgi:hypothetical protein
MNSIRLCQERKVGLKPWVMREEEGAKPRKKEQAEKKKRGGDGKKEDGDEAWTKRNTLVEARCLPRYSAGI